MLSRLLINNFILIDRLELEFNDGFTVITGETGSGKSIIIDALLFIFGDKMSGSSVRASSDKAVFEADFIDITPFAVEFLQSNDLLGEEKNTVICRRVLDVSGKSRGYINGYSVNIAQLRELGELLLNIHSQHTSIGVLSLFKQRQLFDDYAGIDISQLKYRYKSIVQLQRRIADFVINNAAVDERRKMLHEQYVELQSLQFTLDNWLDLQRELLELSNAENITRALGSVSNTVTEGEINVTTLINQCNTQLMSVADYIPGKINNILQILNNICIGLQELSREVSIIGNTIVSDSSRLSYIEERISDIVRVSNRCKIKPEGIVERLSQLEADLSGVEYQNLDALQAELATQLDEYNKLAMQISERRKQCALMLSEQMTNMLSQLAIDGQFFVRLTTINDISEYGLEQVEYYAQFNQGIAAQKLSQAASGGELSRVSLALYILLNINNDQSTIIFDEIDVGIGGRIAGVVGDMLRKLGESKQVISITHQPQTASRGVHHLICKKLKTTNTTTLSVQYGERQDRIDEISRMISDCEVTDNTIRYATELLLGRSA